MGLERVDSGKAPVEPAGRAGRQTGWEVELKTKVILAAAALVLVGVLSASPSSAQYTGGTPPTAGPVVNPVAVPPAKAEPVKVQVGRPTPAARTRSFALTGADIAQMVLLGGAFLLGGALLVRQGRRRVTVAS